MVPDFGLLLPVSLTRLQTHSLSALVTFCLPVVLLVYLLTQLLIRPAVIEILPDRAYARLRQAPPWLSWRAPRTWLLVSGAVLFGALTHLIWDGFTHENARGVRLFPQLLDYGPDMAGHQLQLWRWLQYGSSVIGLALVLAAIAVWLRHAPTPPPFLPRRLGSGERLFWVVLYGALPLAAVVLFALHLQLAEHIPLLSGGGVERTGVVSMQAAALSLLLVSGLIRARLHA